MRSEEWEVKSEKLTFAMPFGSPMYVMLKPVGSRCNLSCRYCYYLDKGSGRVMDEALLEEMDQEELSDFRDQLQDTLDQMMTEEPDPDEEEEAYYEWEDRINILNDLIDAIGDRLGS